MNRSLATVAAFGALALAPLPAFASFHDWEIKEVYSNSDGSIQFIEFFTTSNFQEVVGTQKITVTNGTITNEYTFPANLASGTAGKHFVIATPGFARISGAVTPDFTLPCGPFIPLSGTTITINFVGADTVTFALATLPTDGSMSLTDTTFAGAFVAGTNSPTNYGGTAGTVALSSCQAAGSCDACEDQDFCNGVETCSASACQAGANPCTTAGAQQCIEASDTCVECINAGHCSDNNPCTDDICNASNECENPNRTGSCDDLLFCNGADTCVSGVCEHAGTPCGVINCNEGPETCGDCTGQPDCEDGESCTVDTCTTGQCARTTNADGVECDTDSTFCNGVGTCTAGICGGVAAPCDATTETCDETGDACSALVVPDAAIDPGESPPEDDGCCQANPSLATVTGPALILLFGLAAGRRRRRR